MGVRVILMWIRMHEDCQSGSDKTMGSTASFKAGLRAWDL